MLKKILCILFALLLCLNSSFIRTIKAEDQIEEETIEEIIDEEAVEEIVEEEIIEEVSELQNDDPVFSGTIDGLNYYIYRNAYIVDTSYVIRIYPTATSNAIGDHEPDEVFAEVPELIRDKVESVLIGEGIKSLGSYAIDNLKRLREVELPSTLESAKKNAIPQMNDKGALFVNCEITYRFQSGWCGTDVTTIKGLRLSDLQVFVPMHTHGMYVMNNGDAYVSGKDPRFSYSSYNYDVKRLILNDSITDIQQCMGFDNCEEIVMTDSVVRISGTLPPLKTLHISKYVTSIDGGVSRGIMDPVNLEELIIDEDNPVYFSPNNQCIIERDTMRLIMAGKLPVPEGVKVLTHGCFAKSDGNNIKLPSTLEVIEGFAFPEMKGSAKNMIIIPEGVKTIKENAFSGALENVGIFIPSTVETIEKNAINFRAASYILTDATSRPAGWDAEMSSNNPVFLTGVSKEFAQEIHDFTAGTSSSITGFKYANDKHTAFATTYTDPRAIHVFGTGEATFNAIGYFFDEMVNSSDNVADGEHGLNIYIHEGITDVGSRAFLGLVGVESVELPDSLEKFDFDFENEIANLRIPKGVKEISDSTLTYITCYVGNVEIAEENTVYDSRDNCGAVIETATNTLLAATESAKVPAGVEVIATKAFSMNGIESITLGRDIKKVEAGAIQNCPDLKSVFVSKDIDAIEGNIFTYNAVGADNLTIYTDLKETDPIPEGWASSWNNYNYPVVYNVGSQESFEYIAGNDSTKVREGYLNMEHTVSYELYDDNTLIVFGEGETNGFAFNNGSNIPEAKNVIICEGVTAIGNSTFFESRAIETIVFPESLTRIDEYAFGFAGTIKEINIPKNVTSISKTAFHDAGFNGNLTKITVEEGNSNYTAGSDNNILYSLNDDVLLKMLPGATIPETTKTIVEGALYNGSGIKHLYIPDSVEVIEGNAFTNMTSLVSAYLPGAASLEANVVADNPSSTVFYTSALSKPTNWSDYFKASGSVVYDVTTAEYLMWHVNDFSDVSELVIPEGVRSIPAHFFENNTKLTKVVMPTGLTDIGEAAFKNCVNLEKVEVGNGLKNIGAETFMNNKLEKLELPASVETIGTKAFLGNGETLISIVVEGNGHYHSDSANASLIETESGKLIVGTRNSVFDDNINEIGANAFQGVKGLKSLILSNDIVKINDNAFKDCDDLELVYLAGSVKFVGNNVFVGVSDNMTIYTDVPTSIENDWDYGFNALNEEWTKLSEVVYGWSEADFRFWCLEDHSNDSHLIIPDGVTFIPEYKYENNDSFYVVTISDTVKTIGARAFKNAKKLNGVVFGEGVESIGAEAFMNDHITEIILPAATTSIDDTAFAGTTGYVEYILVDKDNPVYRYDENCGSLINSTTGTLMIGTSNAVIGEDVLYIAPNAFKNVSGLKSIIIAEDVIEIGDNAFTGCGDLEHVYLASSVATVGNNVFVGANDNLTIYTDVPTSIENDWDYGFNALNEEWSKLADVIYGWSSEDFSFWLNEEKLSKDQFYIELPAGITFIPENAFDGYEKTLVYFMPDTVKEVGENGFTGANSGAIIFTSFASEEEAVEALGENFTSGLEVIYGSSVEDAREYVAESTNYGGIWPEDVEMLQSKGILATDITDTIWVANLESSYVYTGSQIKPNVRVYYGKTLLTEGVDYAIKYSNNVVAANNTAEKAPTITVTGKGAYKGKATGTFTIEPKLLVNKIDNMGIEYKGKPVALDIRVSYNGKYLKQGTDFDVFMEDGSLVTKLTEGTYNLTIVYKGNYTGSQNFEALVSDYAFGRLDISKAIVTNLEPSYTYTGSPIEPVVAVDCNGYRLDEGYSYEVSYEKNVDKGTAVLVINGINECKGTIKKKFKIEPAVLTDENVIVSPVGNLVGGVGRPQFLFVVNGDNLLKEGKDYTIKYANNKAVGDATVTITGKGNYTGSLSYTFKIMQGDITDNLLMASDVLESSKSFAWKNTKVSVTDSTGKALKANKDYKVTGYFLDNECTNEVTAETLAAGTSVFIKVEGLGIYNGETAISYRIVEAGKDISKATFKIADQTYTGQPVTITKDDVTLATLNKQPLALENFEIVGYLNNIKKGSAKVILHGVDEYGGYKTVSFKIGQVGIGGSKITDIINLFK